MAVGYTLAFAVCFLLSLVNAEDLQIINGRIKITVVTTAGCSDAAEFIRDLAAVYELYKDFLDIEFIPWGRTLRNSDDSLTCQFGTNDCWANRLHRCVLNKLNGNLEAQMHYMTCEFNSPYPSYVQGSYICAHAVGLSLIDVDYCVANPKSDELDAEAERKGTPIMQVINDVPSIVFNDEINVQLHTQSLSRLSSMICFALAEDPSTGVTNCSL